MVLIRFGWTKSMASYLQKMLNSLLSSSSSALVSHLMVYATQLTVLRDVICNLNIGVSALPSSSNICTIRIHIELMSICLDYLHFLQT